jgi:hypothetical protein
MSQDNPYAATNTSYQNQFNSPPHVPDYLIWAILETIFCCLPFGIAGIVFAAMANSAKQQGNFPLAMDHAKKAKLFLLIGLAGWACIVIFYIVIMVVAVMSQGIQ